MRIRWRATRVLSLAAMVLLGAPLTGCLVVSYSSGSGWYVWPGSLILTGLILLFMFLRMRH
jgi:hypothetical protein